MSKSRCRVWLPMDHRLLGTPSHGMPFWVLGEKYARAVKEGAQALPVLFPMAQVSEIPELLAQVDGVMLTGSKSNIHPQHFDEALADPDSSLDPERDALTLALVQACVAGHVPLLGVCRGFQEMNVAMGGSLHQQVHRVAGMADHREPAHAALAQQYAPAHEVRLSADSALAAWAGGLSVQVNSLHGQGIHRLAAGLRAVGHAPDGLIEAFEVEGAQTFAYGVQWHPEWQCLETPFYAAIFSAFGHACRVRQRQRLA